MTADAGWQLPDRELVLASASPTRHKMLAAARLNFTAHPVFLDEEGVRQAARSQGMVLSDIAVLLAEMKAEAASHQHPDCLIIGCDQLLICGDEIFAKPATRQEAASHLGQLQGRTHQLATAVVIYARGQRLWHHLASPALTMRPLDQAQIASYLEIAGEEVLSSPGCYQIEGPGAQLMQAVSGDYFAILGLPLLPLLAQLREFGLSAGQIGTGR